jgi:hypothetical protein
MRLDAIPPSLHRAHAPRAGEPADEARRGAFEQFLAVDVFQPLAQRINHIASAPAKRASDFRKSFRIEVGVHGNRRW